MGVLYMTCGLAFEWPREDEEVMIFRAGDDIQAWVDRVARGEPVGSREV